MNIKTHYDYPPIPNRLFDWSAIDDVSPDSRSPVGHGATEEEAIADLKEQIAERKEALLDRYHLHR